MSHWMPSWGVRAETNWWAPHICHWQSHSGPWSTPLPTCCQQAGRGWQQCHPLFPPTVMESKMGKPVHAPNPLLFTLSCFQHAAGWHLCSPHCKIKGVVVFLNGKPHYDSRRQTIGVRDQGKTIFLTQCSIKCNLNTYMNMLCSPAGR